MVHVSCMHCVVNLTGHLKILTDVSLYLKTQVWLDVTMGIPGLQMETVGFVIHPCLLSLLFTVLLSL